MERAVLMTTHEPSDKELAVLMHDVASEAKKKALSVKKKFSESIALEIQKARLKLDSYQTMEKPVLITLVEPNGSGQTSISYSKRIKK